MRIIIWLSACFLTLWTSLAIASAEQSFRVVQITNNLQNPWGMAFLPDNSLLITQRLGRLSLLEDGELKEISGVPPVNADGQGGLLGIAVHPRYLSNGWIYFSHSSDYDNGVGTVLSRGRVDRSTYRLIDVQTIYRMPAPGGGGQHFGSRIVFDAAGFLYLTIGDRGQQNRAQELSRAEGKVLRLHDDGSIPADNPFVNVPNALGEIFTLGHRNPQGLFFDPGENRLWLHEHGPQGGDTLVILAAGANYGWPIATYGVEYGSGRPIGMQPHELDYISNPYTYWVPTSIAPSGLTLYRGHAFPKWRGDLFLGALAQQHIHRVVPGTDGPEHKQELLRNAYGRIRDVVTGPDELIYFLRDGWDGALFRLEPEGTSPWFSIMPTEGWRDSSHVGHQLGWVYDAHWPWITVTADSMKGQHWLWVKDTNSAPYNGLFAWRAHPDVGGWIFLLPELGFMYDFTTAEWSWFWVGD